jgi:hypothetical protein
MGNMDCVRLSELTTYSFCHHFLYYIERTVVIGEGNKKKQTEFSSCSTVRNMNRYFFCRRPHISGYCAPGSCWLGVLDWRLQVFLPAFVAAETFGRPKSSNNTSLSCWSSVTTRDSLLEHPSGVLFYASVNERYWVAWQLVKMVVFIQNLKLTA